MMFKSVVLVLALAAAASAYIPPPATPLCAQYLLSDQNLGATPGFIPNVIFYNANSLKSGTPLGPYIGLVPGLNCVFTPNSSLSCGVIIYEDASHTQQIGSGTLSGAGTLSQSNGFIGGTLTLAYTITAALTGSYSPPLNFQSQSVTLFFGASQMYPTDLSQAAVANKAIYSADAQTGVLTLWGSNGWNGSAYSGQTTGFDFRATLTCAPQGIIPPCTASAGSSFTAPYGCVAANDVVRFHSSTSSISLAFSAGAASSGACSNF